jgi:hypothetical protein
MYTPHNLANYYEWTQMQERLAELTYPDPQGQSICSYQFVNTDINACRRQSSIE